MYNILFGKSHVGKTKGFFLQAKEEEAAWVFRGSSSNTNSGRVVSCRDRIVVSTLCCGHSNPGSNPGHGRFFWMALNFSSTLPPVLLLRFLDTVSA